MASCPERPNLWLKDRPDIGVRIRGDVQAASERIWRKACQQTQKMLGDSSDTAALLELAAAQASNYLDVRKASNPPTNVAGLLWKIFSRLLSRYAKRFRRLEPAGRVIEWRILTPSWENRVINQLFFEQLKRHLDDEGSRILSYRLHGYEWAELSELFGVSVADLKSRFWRAIAHAKAKLGIVVGDGGQPSSNLSKRKTH